MNKTFIFEKDAISIFTDILNYLNFNVCKVYYFNFLRQI